MMDINEWMTDGKFHAGSHFPLAVWTHNSSSRSQEGHERRQQKRKDKRKSAVAANPWKATGWSSYGWGHSMDSRRHTDS